MAAKVPSSSHNLRSFLRLFHLYGYKFRSSPSVCRQYGSYSSSKMADKVDFGCNNSMKQQFHMFSTAGGGAWKNVDANRVKSDMLKPQVPDHPASFNFPTWAKWVLGSILSILLPFWKQKWERLKVVEGQAEIVMKEVETVTNVVEKVATVAEHASEEIAQKLPENSKLKKTVLAIEHISEVAAHDAQLTEDIIHKVEELKHDFDELDNTIESTIEKFIQQKSQK